MISAVSGDCATGGPFWGEDRALARRAAEGRWPTMTSTQGLIGSIVSLWRYPVKSMMGEELNAAEVTKRGLLGDRAYALVDSSDGKVASAKNPRKWPPSVRLPCRAHWLRSTGQTSKGSITGTPSPTSVCPRVR